MSDCKAYRREIDEAADGRAVSAGVGAHAALCRACAEGLRERESLRALVGGLGKVEAPADFEFRLRARMAAAKADRGRGRSGGRWLYGFAPVAVAACFVLVSATLYLRQAARLRATGEAAVASVVPARVAEPGRVASADGQKVVPFEPAATGRRVAKAEAEGAASPKPLKAVHRSNPRPAQAREVALRGERRAEPASRTAVSSFSTAPVLRPVTFTLKAPAEPLRMILRDERGAERVVPMRAVSFGSQDLAAREAAAKQSGAAGDGGVW
jgi:hypothetical protein